MKRSSTTLAAGIAVTLTWALCASGPVLAAEKAAPAKTWSAKPYKPKSHRDFTGIWSNPDGVAWDPGVSQAVRLTAPLTPEYMAMWQKQQENAKAGRPTRDPTAACAPAGMPRMMTMTFPMEIVQNDRQVNVLAEWGEQTRRIFIDGRPLPDKETLDPTYKGYSVGRWEGDVLVVDTIGLRGDTNLEASGIMHSDALTVHERIWLATDNLLMDEITLVDPKAYTRPWTVTKRYNRMEPDANIMEYVCLENNRNPTRDDGSVGVILTQ
jgi:hypothetical protein